MAAATVTLTAYNENYGTDLTAKRFIMRGTAAISASPATYATGGLAVTYTEIKSADGNAVLVPGQNTTPDSFSAYSVSGSGYIYSWNKSTGKLMILVQGAAATDPLAEIGNGTAIAAAISGDTIEFTASWVRD